MCSSESYAKTQSVWKTIFHSQCTIAYSNSCLIVRSVSVVSSTLLRMIYGVSPAYDDDEILAIVDEGLIGPREVLVSGGFLVDFLPFLRYAPPFVPFRKKFAKWRVDNDRMFHAPFEKHKAILVSPTTGAFALNVMLT